MRDKIGSFRERNDMETVAEQLDHAVRRSAIPASAGEETKAQYPLAAAEVTVEEVEGNPGYYRSRFYLRPHYQLEGLTVSLRLVSKLPSVKAADDAARMSSQRAVASREQLNRAGRPEGGGRPWQWTCSSRSVDVKGEAQG